MKFQKQYSFKHYISLNNKSAEEWISHLKESSGKINLLPVKSSYRIVFELPFTVHTEHKFLNKHVLEIIISLKVNLIKLIIPHIVIALVVEAILFSLYDFHWILFSPLFLIFILYVSHLSFVYQRAERMVYKWVKFSWRDWTYFDNFKDCFVFHEIVLKEKL